LAARLGTIRPGPLSPDDDSLQVINQPQGVAEVLRESERDLDDALEDNVLLVAANFDLIPPTAVGLLDAVGMIPVGQLSDLIVVPVDEVEIQRLVPPIVPATQKARRVRLLIHGTDSEYLEAARGAPLCIGICEFVAGSQEVTRLDRHLIP
jgi:hypothetical protein